MVKGSGAGRRGKKPHGNPPHYQFDARSLMKDLANKREQDMARQGMREVSANELIGREIDLADDAPVRWKDNDG